MKAPSGKSDKLIIYFHANAEDLGNSYLFLDHLRTQLKVNVLAPEYPGYGIYREARMVDKNRKHAAAGEMASGVGEDDSLKMEEGQTDSSMAQRGERRMKWANGTVNYCYKTIQCSSEQIKEDADCIYDFALKNIENLVEQNIIIIGRSIGSGPSLYLAAERKPGAVILISAFKSIKSVAYENFGFLSALVQEQFDNIQMIGKLSSPCLLIHGKKDEFINYTHSEELHSQCSGSELHLSSTMRHNTFDFQVDIVQPIRRFL